MGLNPSHGIKCVIFSVAFQGFESTLSLGETATLQEVEILTHHFSSSSLYHHIVRILQSIGAELRVLFKLSDVLEMG